jgi:hypothetical protein
MSERPDHPPVHDDADLLALWRRLMGPGGFGRRSLWTVWLDEHGMRLPVIVPIDDLPNQPDQLLVDNFVGVIGGVLRSTEARTVAVLLLRPGPSAKSADDRAWAVALIAAARRAGVAMWPVHIATNDLVQVFAPDDLMSASTHG